LEVINYLTPLKDTITKYHSNLSLKEKIMDQYEHGRKHSEEMNPKGFNYAYGNILRSRLSSTSSEGMVGSPPTGGSMNDHTHQGGQDYKMANPTEAIPLHWKEIPLPWK